MPTVSLFPGVYYNPSRIANPGPLLADAAAWQPRSPRPSSSARGPEREIASEPAQEQAAGARADEGHHHAARLFSDWAGTVAGEWLARQVLVRDQAPTLYVYRASRPVPDPLRHGPGVPESGSCLAVVAAVGLDGAGRLRVVETLAPAEVEQMVPVMKAFALDVAPVWALFSRASAGARRARLDELLSQATEAEPLLAFEGEDGGTHRLWRLAPEQARELADLLSALPLAVAQGGLQVAALERLAGQAGDRRGDGAPPSVLAFITPVDAEPASGQTPAVLPVHRLLLASSRIPADDLEARVSTFFRLLDVEPPAGAGGDGVAHVDAALAQLGTAKAEFNGFVLYLGRGRVRLVRSKGRMFMENWTHPLGRSTWRAMDVNVLHALVFERALGMRPEQSRTNAPPLAVEVSARRAVERVDAGEAVAAFLLPPPSPSQLLAVALDNNPIPADSVRPWPPIPAGVVFRWRRTS